jgi:uncharacterized membrane protein YgdD (TMEM256/DUF423 family)
MATGSRVQLCVAAILLAIATTHGLDRLVDAGSLANFKTGVDYHFFHALGLLGLALARDRFRDARMLGLAGWLLVAGIVLFSGTLYAGAFVALGPLNLATPVGGLALIAGWLLAAYAILLQPKSGG